MCSLDTMMADMRALEEVTNEARALRTRLDSEHHARLEAERRLAEAVEVLRHSDSRLTADTYGHLELDDGAAGALAAFPAAPAGSHPGMAAPRLQESATPGKAKGAGGIS